MLQRKDRTAKHIKSCEEPLGDYFLGSKSKSKFLIFKGKTQKIEKSAKIHEISGFKQLGLIKFNKMEYIINHISIYIPENYYVRKKFF